MPLREPVSPTTVSWLAVGVRALDTATSRTGVIQLLRDDLGEVITEVIQRPTRALLRPVGRERPSWWVHVNDLDQPPRSRR